MVQDRDMVIVVS